MKPKAAAAVQVGACDCPSLHVHLKDKHGRVFATACMPLETGRALAADIIEAVNEAAAREGQFSCQAVH